MLGDGLLIGGHAGSQIVHLLLLRCQIRVAGHIGLIADAVQLLLQRSLLRLQLGQRFGHLVHRRQLLLRGLLIQRGVQLRECRLQLGPLRQQLRLLRLQLGDGLR